MFRPTSEPIIFLYATIYMINLSILPQFVLQKLCLQKHNGNASSCSVSEVEEVDQELQKSASEWWFIIIASAQIPSVITCLIWGPLSDAIGRRASIYVVPSVSLIQNLVFVGCAYFATSHMGFVVLGFCLSTLFGQFPGVISLCYGFITEVTADNKEARIARLAFVDASIFFAGVLSGLGAGQLLERLGFVAVFIFSITINTFLLLYITFLLPDLKKLRQKEAMKSTEEEAEELQAINAKAKEAGEENADETSSSTSENSKGSPQKFCLSLLNPYTQIKQVFRVIFAKDTRRMVLPPLLAFTFSIYAYVGDLTSTALYLKGPPFLMTADYIGYYYAIQACLRGIGVISVTQISHRFLHLSDMNLMLFGIASEAITYTAIGLSKTRTQVYCVNIIGLGLPVANALLRGYTTKQVAPENYGALLAAFASLDCLAYTTNAITLEIYRATLDSYPGAMFVFLGACAGVAFLIMFIFKFYIQRFPAKTPEALMEKSELKSDL